MADFRSNEVRSLTASGNIYEGKIPAREEKVLNHLNKKIEELYKDIYNERRQYINDQRPHFYNEYVKSDKKKAKLDSFDLDALYKLEKQAGIQKEQENAHEIQIPLGGFNQEEKQAFGKNMEKACDYIMGVQGYNNALISHFDRDEGSSYIGTRIVNEKLKLVLGNLPIELIKPDNQLTNSYKLCLASAPRPWENKFFNDMGEELSRKSGTGILSKNPTHNFKYCVQLSSDVTKVEANKFCNTLQEISNHKFAKGSIEGEITFTVSDNCVTIDHKKLKTEHISDTREISKSYFIEKAKSLGEALANNKKEFDNSPQKKEDILTASGDKIKRSESIPILARPRNEGGFRGGLGNRSSHSIS
jgi:hypothetical protein